MLHSGQRTWREAAEEDDSDDALAVERGSIMTHSSSSTGIFTVVPAESVVTTAGIALEEGSAGEGAAAAADANSVAAE